MADFIAGFNAKALLGRSPDASTPYAFATYRIRAAGMQHDVSNSEGLAGNSALGDTPQLGAVGNTALDVPVFESRLPGLVHFEATIRQATFDATNNPFAAPIILDVNFYFAIIVFYTQGGTNWECPSFLINDIDSDGDVRGLQPVSFSGMSDGGFLINI